MNEDLHLFASQGTDLGKDISKGFVSIPKQGKAVVQFTFKVPHAGNWTLTLSDYFRRNLSDKVAVEAKYSYNNNSEITTDKCTFDNETDGKVFGRKLSGKLSLRGTNGPCKIPISIRLYWVSDKYLYHSSIETEAEFNNIGTATLDYAFKDLIAGKYIISVYRLDKEKYIENPQAIELKSGIVLLKKDGSEVGKDPDMPLVVDEDVVSVGMSHLNQTPKLTPNKNPNTLYYFSNESYVPESLKDKNVICNDKATKITLTDGYDVFIPKSFEAEEVTYTRNADDKNSGWSTLVLPFEAQTVKVGNNSQAAPIQMAKANNSTQVRILSFDDIANTSLFFNPSTQLCANRPYLLHIAPDKANQTVSFGATKAKIEATNNMMRSTDTYIYKGVLSKEQMKAVYCLSDDGKTFVRKESEDVKAFRAVFEARNTMQHTAGQLQVIASTDMPKNSPTSIDGIDDTTSHDVVIYTLNGQRVNSHSLSLQQALHSLPKGIYIINGKKYAVK